MTAICDSNENSDNLLAISRQRDIKAGA